VDRFETPAEAGVYGSYAAYGDGSQPVAKKKLFSRP
jgi:hypothetical protein